MRSERERADLPGARSEAPGTERRRAACSRGRGNEADEVDRPELAGPTLRPLLLCPWRAA